MATQEEFPWTRTGQATNGACIAWLEKQYGVTDPIIIVPFFKLPPGKIEGTGLMFVPCQHYELQDRMGRVDLWLNGSLSEQTKKLDGFLPPFYQFAIGVLDVKRSYAPENLEVVIDELRDTCAQTLDDRLRGGLQALIEQGLFQSLVSQWSEEIRMAVGLSSKVEKIFAKYLPLAWSGGSGTLEDIMSDGKISGRRASGMGESEILISLHVDPNRLPYSQMYAERSLKVIDARSPGDYMLLQRLSRERGFRMSRIDTKAGMIDALALKAVAGSQWDALVRDFSKATFGTDAEVYALGTELAPAVLIPTVDEEPEIRQGVQNVMRAGIPEKNRAYVEYTQRASHRGVNKWTLLLNADDPLIQLLLGFASDGTARRIGINYVEVLAHLSATETVREEHQKQAWLDIQELLSQVDKLERQRDDLQKEVLTHKGKVEQLKADIERMELIRERDVGEHAGRILTLSKELRVLQDRLQEEESDHKKTLQDLTDIDAQLQELRQKLEIFSSVSESKDAPSSIEEAERYLLRPEYSFL